MEDIEEFDLLERLIDFGNAVGEDYNEGINGYLTAEWETAADGDRQLRVDYQFSTEEGLESGGVKRYKFVEVL